MSHKHWNLVAREAALSLSVALFVSACADGVPLDELFPDAGRPVSQSHSGSAGSSTSRGNGFGSAGNTGPIDMGGSGMSGSSDNGQAGTEGSGGSSGSGAGGGPSSGGAGGGAGSSGGSGGGGGSGNHAGATGSGGASAGCSAPAWDSSTIYCAQGVMGTEVSLKGKKYACHYWTQAQNPEDHNSADGSEPWSTPTTCP